MRKRKQSPPPPVAFPSIAGVNLSVSSVAQPTGHYEVGLGSVGLPIMPEGFVTTTGFLPGTVSEKIS
jgi:hypothetical protein